MWLFVSVRVRGNGYSQPVPFLLTFAAPSPRPAALAQSGDEQAAGTLPADIPPFSTEGFGSRSCTWQATLSAFVCCAARASWCAASAARPALLGSGFLAHVFTQTKRVTPRETLSSLTAYPSQGIHGDLGWTSARV